MNNRSLKHLLSLLCFLPIFCWNSISLAQPQELGTLPWQQDRLSDMVIPFSIANSTTAKQMLEISGIGDSQLRFFIDNEPVAGKDIDTTGYVLRNFHDLDSSDIKRWASSHSLDSKTLLEAFLETPDDYRVDFYRLRGHVYKIKRQPIVEEAARLLGFRSFFWVWLRPQNSNVSVRIATRKLPIAWFPSAWKTTTTISADGEKTEENRNNELPPDASFELNQPAAVDGLLLKVAAVGESPEQETREIVMAAQRVEWLPRQPSAQLRINKGISLLSQFEFDAGLLDDLRRSNGKAMNRADTEAFFQILSIVNKKDFSLAIEQFAQNSPPSFHSISEYLQNTRQLQGELINLEADVRQITKVEISNEKMKFRLGINHYWQLDAFVYLGGDAIELKTNAGDQDGLVYKHRYPVQICVTKLPAELQHAQSQIQHGTYRRNSLHEEISVSGFFFKLWTYQSARTIGAGGNRVQLSPLFIANRISVREAAGLNTTRGSIYLGLGFLVLLAVVAGFLVKTNRADDGFRKHTESTRHTGGLDPGLLSDLEVIDFDKSDS